MRKLLFIILLLMITVEASAQIKLRGTLQDSTDHNALSFANIGLLKQSDSTFVCGTTTEENGGFELQVPDSGKYIIRISYIGYGTQMRPLQLLESNKTIDLGIVAVAKGSTELSAVEIVASKPMYTYEGEKRIYNVSEDPSVQGGVANDALQNAPGVYVDMEGNITLRGVSGVEIWINDKPSRIKAEGLKSFLQQLPANSIERIEVITNPSARYGASGTGGIINIVTKEKIKRNLLFSFGLNGSTQVSYSPWVSFVIGNDKVSFNTYLTRSYFEGDYESISSGYLLNEGDSLYKIENVSNGYYNYAYTYGHINFSWEIDKQTSLNAWFGGSFSSSESNSYSHSIRTMAGGEVFDITQNGSGGSDGSQYYSGLSLEHRFKKEGHKISLDGYLGNNTSDNLSTNERLYATQTWKNRRYTDKSLYDGSWWSAELNYENPLGTKRSIEAGGEFNFSPTIQDSPVDTFDFSTGVFVPVPLYSNYLDQKTMGASLYITYTDTLWFLKYKAGLRYEYAHLNMNSVALSEELNRSYGTLFPTLHLSYTSKKSDIFSVSYSRRVHYPEYELDPFEQRMEEETVYFGNPYLDPAFTDAFEGGYSRYFKSGSSISATLYHRRTLHDITDKSEGVYDSLLNRYTIYSTYINAGKRIFTGLDLTAMWRPSKAYRIMLNFNLYDQDFYADLGSYIVDKHNLTYNGKLIFMWNYKNLRFNLTGVYRAASANLQGSDEPTYWINSTINADLFDRKLSLRLGMQDIFNWLENSSSTNTPSVISESYSKSKSQYLTFGITFRFGKVELEQQQMQPNVQSPM